MFGGKCSLWVLLPSNGLCVRKRRQYWDPVPTISPGRLDLFDLNPLRACGTLPRHIELATGRAVTAALPVGQGGPKPCESELLTRSGTFFQKIRHLVYYFVTLRLALME